MYKFIEFLKKRPADKTIRIGRALFGFIILLLLCLPFNEFQLSLVPKGMKSYETSIKGALLILGIVPIIMGAFDPCFLKRKYMRILQIVFGIVLIIVGKSIIFPQIEVQKSPSNTSSSTGSIAITDIVTKEKSVKRVDYGFWIALLGWLPLIAGVSGKCITQKCFKYGEKITKIRV